MCCSAAKPELGLQSIVQSATEWMTFAALSDKVGESRGSSTSVSTPHRVKNPCTSWLLSENSVNIWSQAPTDGKFISNNETNKAGGAGADEGVSIHTPGCSASKVVTGPELRVSKRITYHLSRL